MANTKITTNVIADGAITSAKLDTNIDIAGTLDVTGATTLDSTLSVSGNITGTLATAAQPNITSVGTLTGLNVAGTPTFDGLTVDGDISINDSSPMLTLTDTDGTNQLGRIYQAGATLTLNSRDNTSFGAIDLVAANGSQTYNRLTINSGGDISFYEDTGSTAKFFWDASAERLGIGAAPTARTFEVNAGNANTAARFTSTDSRSALEFVDSAGSASIGNLGSHLTFLPAGVQLMELNNEGGLIVTPTAGGHTVFNEGSVDADFRVESNGNTHMLFVDGGNDRVGIGTSSPDSLLDIEADPPVLTLTNSRDGSWTTGDLVGHIKFFSNDASGIGSHEVGFIKSVVNQGNTSLGTALTFGTATYNGAATEAIRIDEDGSLLVGTTDVDLGYTDGDTGVVAKANGVLQCARDSSFAPLYVQKLNNNGDLIEFNKDGSSVGSIATHDTRLAIGSDDTYIMFDSGVSPAIWPSNGTAALDNTIDIGDATRRFKDIYLSGGVYLGGTGSANKLDDYEEGYHNYTVVGSVSGSWTPRSGWTQMAYTKVGRLVTVTGQIEVSGSSSPSGDARISLPFAVASTNAQFSARVAIGLRNQGQSQSGVIYADAVNANAYFRIVQITDSGSLSFLSNSTLDASWEFNFTMTYMAD